MSTLAQILISLAAAAAFFFIEPYLLGLEQPWKAMATLIVLVVAGVLAHVLLRNGSVGGDSGRPVLSGNEAGKDLEIEADKLDTTQGRSKIASDNKAGGKMNIKVTDSKL
jgi:hypothetical protein